MRFITHSIRNKILLVLISVFIALIVLMTLLSAGSQKDMVMDIAVEKTHQIATGYFDNLNTMMLSGTMAQRHILKEKLLEEKDITRVKVIRAEAVTKQFGQGNADEKVEDDLDRQGIETKQEVITRIENDQGRSVSVIIPLFASKNYKGTNCITCHIVPEGTLLGTVRVDSSLEHLDEIIFDNLNHQTWINVITMIVGLLIISWYVNFVVVKPLEQIGNTMTKSSEDQDLNLKINIRSQDEVGNVASAFNSMTDHFSQSLGQVSDAIKQLNKASSLISQSSMKTSNAVQQQQQETHSVVSAMHQLEQSVNDVSESANEISRASIESDLNARTGSATTGEAIKGILELVNKIDLASTDISELHRQSEAVGSVLDVIKGIAEQTNLLALNAAIEAARAGEMGRGFAVVADEVRTLATRSHESTQEIESIVEQLQQGTQKAVAGMQEAKLEADQRKDNVESADNTLKEIVSCIHNILDKNASMQSRLEEQNRIAETVHDNINKIDTLSESTAGNAEETSSQSDEIVRLALNLNKLINEFKF